uniref:Uncharacterized protein n=1 Tax=Coniferiporia sulphurascens TaxID=175648 RepID=A0A5B9RDD9_CONSH|nr:hypothetical protein PSUO_000050 [Coniferiporia sulphurascens]QEG57190.1 hypothetical protein PSUO_000050 [Coniferiporia sulphurascens]
MCAARLGVLRIFTNVALAIFLYIASLMQLDVAISLKLYIYPLWGMQFTISLEIPCLTLVRIFIHLLAVNNNLPANDLIELTTLVDNVSVVVNNVKYFIDITKLLNILFDQFNLFI